MSAERVTFWIERLSDDKLGRMKWGFELKVPNRYGCNWDEPQEIAVRVVAFEEATRKTLRHRWTPLQRLQFGSAHKSSGLVTGWFNTLGAFQAWDYGDLRGAPPGLAPTVFPSVLEEAASWVKLRVSVAE